MSIKGVGRADGMCLCGCGTFVGIDKKGRKRKYVLGHQVRSRSMAEWEAAWRSAVASAPRCKCGCGERVPIHGAQTVDSFIEKRGSRTHAGFIRGHQQRHPLWYTELTDTERMAIYGTLLGDSSISYPHDYSNAPVLACNHGYKQLEWARHKRSVLQRLDPAIRVAKNDGYGSNIVRVRLPCLPCLCEVFDVCRPNGGPKIVTQQWLDKIGDIGLAWWIGDDGSCDGRSTRLHTEGFDDDSQERIAEWFEKKFCGATVVKHRTGYRNIYLTADTQRAILPVVEPHIPQCMQYKLASCRRCVAGGRRRRVRHNR